MKSEDVTGLLERRPLVLTLHVELGEEKRNLPLTDVARQHAGRDLAPAGIPRLVLPELPIDDEPAVALDDGVVGLDDDALDEPLVHEHLAVELVHLGIRPEEILDRLLKLTGRIDTQRDRVRDPRISRVEPQLLDRDLLAAHGDLPAVEDDLIDDDPLGCRLLQCLLRHDYS